jgi:hypothetical protein
MDLFDIMDASIGVNDRKKEIDDDLEAIDTTIGVNSDGVDYTPSGIKKLFMTKSGVFVKFSDLKNDIKLIKKIENYFTLKTKLITGQMKQLKCCRLDKAKSRIIVPRFGIFELLTKKYGLNDYSINCQIDSGKKPSKAFVWKGKQTNNQKLITDYLLNEHFSDNRAATGSAGVILNLEAGQGKSYVAAFLISIIQRKTVIVLHSTSLIEQWVKVIHNSLGESVKIGYYYAKKKKPGDIMIMIVDSAANDLFILDETKYTPIEFYNQFGFAIYDECHTYANKTALTVFKSAQMTYMLGLSATPDEHAFKFDPAVWWSIGPILAADTIPGYESTSEDFKAVVHRIMYYGPPEYTKTIVNEQTEMFSISPTINMICEDQIRNALVVDCIGRSLALNLYTFVFADRREYLTQLKELLKATREIDGEIIDSDDDFTRVVGGAKAEELENAEIKAKVIFTTYPYMGTGKSIIKMNGLVLATPRRGKMKQYINRIFRLGSDATIERHIWDICDMKLKLSGQWSTRLAYYKSKGYAVDTEKITYDTYVTKIEMMDEVDYDIEGANTNIEGTKKDNTKIDSTKKPKSTIDSTKIKSIVSNILARLKE